jgi:polygalacturonase
MHCKILTGYLFFISAFFRTCANDGVFNIRNFGAKGDGIALDTKAINDAINAASVRAKELRIKQ